MNLITTLNMNRFETNFRRKRMKDMHYPVINYLSKNKMNVIRNIKQSQSRVVLFQSANNFINFFLTDVMMAHESLGIQILI